MGDFLTAIKSVSLDTANKRGELLTSVKSHSSKTPPSKKPETLDHEAIDAEYSAAKTLPSFTQATSPAEALKLLRLEPETDTLNSTLQDLQSPYKLDASFSVHATGPLQAQIVHTLLSTIIPTFWNARGSGARAAITSCLRNPTGLNAILARLRSLSDSVQKQGSSGGDAEALRTALSVARHVLKGDSYLRTVQRNLHDSGMGAAKSDIAWKDFVNVLGSGKIISTIAQAEDAIKLRRTQNTLSSGSQHAAWLGRNISYVLQDEGNRNGDTKSRTQAAADLLTKAGRLGYPLQLAKALFGEPIRLMAGTNAVSLVQYCKTHDGGRSSPIQSMFCYLPGHAQAQTLETVLRWLTELLQTTSSRETGTREQGQADISATAGFLALFTDNGKLENQLLARHIEDPVLSTMLSPQIRRAAVMILVDIPAFDLQGLLEKVMGIFNDQLFIKHAPLAQQDAMAQNLLLLAGHVHRANSVALLMIARSSGHMQGVSNRLDASSQRARWLGMVVATAVSSLVDKQGSKMSFGTEDMQSKEAEELLCLVGVVDDAGGTRDFADLLDSHRKTQRRKQNHRQPGRVDKLPVLDGKQTFGPPRPPELMQTEVEGEKITEILDEKKDGEDDEDDSSDDLRPYTKPDSDPEDSDEDATLVNRNKARPPVYIRDLMSMLRDDRDHDVFQMGIKNAASLIRRKNSFGREVKDHAEELASILCNLQNPFATKDFDELRLQGLIAVLLCDVDTLGPWLSAQAFTGDYSLSQRCLILSSLGLGGRELASVDQDEALNPSQPNTSFPTKHLPDHLHNLYTTNTQMTMTKRLDSSTKSLEDQLMRPLALSAAEKTTSHLNVVKVRTFSSRLTNQNRTIRRPPSNKLAKVFNAAFFGPLLTHYQRDTAFYAGHSIYASNPIVLTTFLKTLALLFHASGPATAGLREIVEEFWHLCLSLSVQATGEQSVLEAVLFSLLTLLEVRIAAAGSDLRGLVDEHAKVLQETQEWAGVVFEQLEGSGAREEEAKVRSLAAGVLVRCREVFEAYQEGLMGSLNGA